MHEPYFSPTPFDDFSRILDPSVYVPLPNDWLVGVTDVVDSASAMRRGAYKAVNLAGAAAIAAIANAIGSYDFPFSFSGDGASFAVRREDRVAAEAALAGTVAWAKADLKLALRAALIPVPHIRAHNYDVRVARYATSSTTAYTMFSGGGLLWADAALKGGHYAVSSSRVDERPNLAGLSCDWAPIPAQQGAILSVLVEPLSGVPGEAFTALLNDLLAIFEGDPHQGCPIPVRRPYAVPPSAGVSQPKNGKHKPAPALRIGGSDARRTFGRGDLLANGAMPDEDRPENVIESEVNYDFRKFDDTLRLTVDCSRTQIAAFERLLCDASRAGYVRYGLHQQSEAVLTCFLPFGASRSNIHFLDGADGGYARAAQTMKGQNPC